MTEKRKKPGKSVTVLSPNYVLFIGLGLTFSQVGMASNFGNFLRRGETSSIDRVRNAYEDVQKESAIHSLLQDKTSQALSIVQRVSGPSKIETTKFQHYYKGLEVIGSMAMHHQGAMGVSIRDHVARFDLNTQPSLSPDTAASLARGIAGDLKLKTEPRLEILPNQGNAGSARLVYWVELLGKDFNGDSDIIIDAHSGKLIAHLSKNISLAPVQIYSAKNQGLKITPNPTDDNSDIKDCTVLDVKTHKTSTIDVAACVEIYQDKSALSEKQCQVVDGMQGFPVHISAQSCTQVVSDGTPNDSADQSATKAAENSKQVLNYYQRHFSRDSFDNKGSEVVSVIHGGDHMANAFWMTDKNTMVYGDGDGKLIGDLTQAVDVAGHEMTHGITEHTAKLIMMNESGALNEAFSDFFGKMIEHKGNWIIGSTLFLGPNAPKGIRNLKDPGSLTDSITDSTGLPAEVPYPTQKSEAALVAEGEACDHQNDRCWVHFNSTIPSHASYLVHKSIGEKKAELLYYTVLTQNLTSTDDFKSAAQAIINTCSQIGFTPADCDAVKQAYIDVGLL